MKMSSGLLNMQIHVCMHTMYKFQVKSNTSTNEPTEVEWPVIT